MVNANSWVTPRSCSAVSLRSGSFDPEMLWFLNSLCSWTMKQFPWVVFCLLLSSHVRQSKNTVLSDFISYSSSKILTELLSPPPWNFRITSRSLDSFWAFTGGFRLSEWEAPSSSLGPPFLIFREPTVSQETALMRGGKAPMVLISAVHGACCMAGRGTGLATPVARVWLSGFWTIGTGVGFFPLSTETHSWAPSFGDVVGFLAGAEAASRGVSVPEETLRFSGGFHSTSFFRVCREEEHCWIWFNSNRQNAFRPILTLTSITCTWTKHTVESLNWYKITKGCHLDHQIHLLARMFQVST